MKAEKQHFHPDSPVQRDRRSPVPFIILGLLLAGLAWQARDSWVDALAPPYAETVDHAERSGTSRGQSTGAESARGNLVSLFSSDDYPAEAIRNNEEGTVGVTLQIDRSGRVSACIVDQSSGSDSLDTATCSILTERARFTPARDLAGNAVPDSYTQRVVWKLQ
jgi:TonB family protein